MKQYAGFNIYGIVAKINNDTVKKFLSVLLVVNHCDRNGLQISSDKYYVTFFNSSYNGLQNYIKVGDSLHIFNADIRVDYQAGKTYIESRLISNVHLISSENHSTLLERRNDEVEV